MKVKISKQNGSRHEPFLGKINWGWVVALGAADLLLIFGLAIYQIFTSNSQPAQISGLVVAHPPFLTQTTELEVDQVKAVDLQQLEKKNSFSSEVDTSSSTFSASPSATNIHLLMGGDVMLGRTVNTQQIKHQDWSWAWKNIMRQTKTADLFFINLEAPLTEKCAATDVGMIFCAPSEAVIGLKAAGVDVVNLANNHILNQGENGLKETIDLLAGNGIGVIGEGGAGTGQLLISEISGLKIGFLGFDDVSQKLSPDHIAAQISASRPQVDFLITSWHWGNEYQFYASPRQTALAHLAIDNGADIVAGHHPHWVQESTTYKNKPIYFSLGNLIFDQMWSQETTQGMMLDLELNPNTPSFLENVTEKPITIHNYGQPTFTAGPP